MSCCVILVISLVGGRGGGGSDQILGNKITAEMPYCTKEENVSYKQTTIFNVLVLNPKCISNALGLPSHDGMHPEKMSMHH